MKGIELVFLAVGAVVGAFVRYRITDTSIVLGGLSINLLLVNVFGSFILGVFSAVSPVLNLDAKYTLFMSIGFCGSLTSMSSFALETCNLLDKSCFYHAALNILANVFLSLGALVSGRALTNIVLETMLY
ncbi:MAG: CrcB family protein [Candidatus Bathyarchaeota archaeon]|nr:CrcB family protein [Candidatus Bathyarchaeum sp.]